MKNKTMYIGLRLSKGTVDLMGHEVDPQLPDGCLGMCYVFDSVESADKYYGKNKTEYAAIRLSEGK